MSATAEITNAAFSCPRPQVLSVELVADAIHDFRGALTVIDQFSSLIADELAGPTTAEQREYLEIITGSVKDLAGMFDDLLEIARIRSGVVRVYRRPQNVAQMIDSVCDALAAKASTEQITLVPHVEPQTCWAYFDLPKAAYSLAKLTAMSITAAPKGSRVSVWAQRRGGVVEVGLTAEALQLPEEESATMAAFFKDVQVASPPPARGFRLGINVAREYIRLNLGQAKLVRDPQAGTSYSFTVPCNAPQAIIECCFNRLAELNKSPWRVAAIRVGPVPGTASLWETIEFVSRHCDPMDLVLACRDGISAIVVTAGSQPHKWIERLHAAHAEEVKTEYVDSVPDIAFELLDSWDLPRQRQVALGRLLELVSQQLADT